MHQDACVGPRAERPAKTPCGACVISDGAAARPRPPRKNRGAADQRLRAGNRRKRPAMTTSVHQFPCLTDNYGALVHDSTTGTTASIDAPESAPIFAALTERGWSLTDVLITHHHADHIQAVPELKLRFPRLKVHGPAKDAARIPFLDVLLGEGDLARVGSLKAKVLETPGHTLGH